MERIGTSDGRFVDGTRRVPGTPVPAWWLNQLQNEMVAILVEAGIAPDKANEQQIVEALKRIIAKRSSIIVDSIEDLRKTAGEEYQVVTVRGYYKDTPGVGGGLFYASKAHTAADDNGTIISGADDTTWYKFDTELTPEDFGARPSGTDNVDLFKMKSNAGGKKYAVRDLPEDCHTSDACFEKAGMLHPTVDFLNVDIAKVTNSIAYTAWPQDSAYLLNNQIKIWVNHASAHYASNIVPGYVLSEDGGTTYQEFEYLDPTLEKHTVWCAGVAHGFEYVFVRTDDKSPWRYKLYKRAVPNPNAGVDSYNIGFDIGDVTFPMPDWATAHDQPLMIHSFTETKDGFVVGASFQEGAGLYRTRDGGGSWEFITLHISSDSEEPTVTYENGIFCGFIRGGNNYSKPRFWISRDDLTSIKLFSSPQGLFGSNNLQDACVPLVLIDGVVHAFTAQRNGTLAATGDDRVTPIYYFKGDVSVADNFWGNAEIYQLGNIYHAENGGASACGQGSVVRYEDKVIFYYGAEERTGNDSAENRVANIWHIAVPLKKRLGATDWRSNFGLNRAARSGIKSLFRNGWMMDPGRLVLRLGRKLSPKFKLAPKNASLVLDNSNGSTGVYGTSGSGWMTFYSIDDSGKTSGLRLDNTNGNAAIITGGEELIRFEVLTKSLRPASDNTVALGGPLTRFSQLFAATGTITTSSKNLKQDIDTIPDDVIKAWREVNWCQYRWRAAVAEKADGARLHVGLIAQDIRDVFLRHGLDATHYGLLCHDQWPAREAIEAECAEDGSVLVAAVPAQEAGELWGIRPDECLALEAESNRRLVQELLARVEKLEKSAGISK